MLDAEGQALYVGKASHLRNRVASYFTRGLLHPRIAAMVAQVCAIEVTVTRTAAEALLLEDQLIKSLKPRYNVMLRDDKSYPYIHLTTADEFPRLAFHRGSRRAKGRYFGPFPSAYSVRDSLNLMQKLFRVRQCEDSFFAHRSRPCLQYQIKRCSAPCTGLIDAEHYAADVRHATLFLEGKSQQVIDELEHRMTRAAEATEYELAALLRDQIFTLQKIQAQQFVPGAVGDMDVIAAVENGGMICVAVLFLRGGRSLGSRTFFPRNSKGSTSADTLEAFVSQYYMQREIPARLVVSESFSQMALLAEALCERAGRRVKLIHRPRGGAHQWLQVTVDTAAAALQTRLAGHLGMQARFESLAELLGFDEPPQRVECFDVSHTQGEATVASCVVFDHDGPVSSDYRRFNIKGVEPGDDYAAMQQALERRYRGLREQEGKMPDLVLIDGGKGQLSRAAAVLEELQLNAIELVGVAKGPSRKVGGETLILGATQQALSPAADIPGFQLIHQIRDEAHRFAISGHRARRGKARQTSVLEGIAGVGAARRRALLSRFGGLQGVRSVGVEELSTVPGISAKLAQRIYDALHD